MLTGTSPPATSAAATSAATGWSTGGARRTACPAKVAAIEYDPNRTARLALLDYADGEKRYILAPVGVNVGDMLLSGEAVDIRPGNTPAGQGHPARHRHPRRRDPARLRAPR